jgi:circadian clock protein KaiB
MKYRLRLYVTGASAHSTAAVANLERICRERMPGGYELEVIDVLEHPERAEQDKILATPTLVRELPPPLRKIVGDLSDQHKVFGALGLDARRDAGTQEDRR